MDCLVERDANGIRSAPLESGTGDRVTDQDLTHNPGAEPQNMRAVLPGSLSLAQEPKVRFVDKSRRLEGVPGSFAPEVVCGKPPELFINARHQINQGFRIHV